MQTFLQVAAIFLVCVIVFNLYFKFTGWIDSVTRRNYAKGMMYKSISDAFSDAFSDVNRKSNLRLVKGEKTNGNGKGDTDG